VQPLPHPGALPVAQPPPAGDRATTTQLPGGQQPPGDARAQLIDDPRQGGAVIDAGGGRRSGVVGWGAAAGWPATAARGQGSRWWWSWPPIMLASRASSKNQPKVGNTLQEPPTAVQTCVCAPMRSGLVKGREGSALLEGYGLAGFSCRRWRPGRSRGQGGAPAGQTTLPPARTGPGSWDEKAGTAFRRWLACTHSGSGVGSA
jgi:hypothetical protein